LHSKHSQILGSVFIPANPNPPAIFSAVLTTRNYGHPGSFKNLLGENPSAEQMEKMSLELNVHGKMPPVFLWHTASDTVVPVEKIAFLMIITEILSDIL